MQPVQLTESFFDLQLSMPAPDQKQVSQESLILCIIISITYTHVLIDI